MQLPGPYPLRDSEPVSVWNFMFMSGNSHTGVLDFTLCNPDL